MKKFILYFVALLPLPFLVACPGKGGGNNSTVVGGISGGTVTIAAGTYAFVGTLTNISPSCGGATSAVITVSQAGYYGNGGNAICTATVGIGGQFNCPVPGNNTYLIRVQSANSVCTVQGNMMPQTNGSQAMQVCLGSGCSCYSSQNCVVNKVQSDMSSIQAGFPGTGDLKINTASLFLNTSKNMNFEISAEASNGNDILNSDGSWKGSVATDGTITLGSEVVESLSYSAQVDAGLLQYSQGFCDSPVQAAKKSADYASQLGFSAKATQAIRDGFASFTERVCVYPQGDAEISRAITLKSGSAMNAYRLWLIVVEESQLAANLKTISRPKTELAKASSKGFKNRKIASSNDLLVEEVALGFVIKK